MTFLQNILANFEIFFSNYTYAYGTITNLVVGLGLVILLVVGMARAASLPKMNRQRGDHLGKEADSTTVKTACEALAKTIAFETTAENTDQISGLIDFLRINYSDVFKTIQCVKMPSQSLLLCWKAPLKPTSNPILLCSHLDVTPAHEVWKIAPFSGHDDGTNLWGRGAIEGKSLIIAQLEGLRQLISQGYVPQRDIYFAYGTDSTRGGYEGAKHMAEIFAKKKLTFDFILDGGGMVTPGHLGNKLYPVAIVGIGEKASVDMVLTARGVGGNAATPRRHTALGSLAEAVCRVESAGMKRRLIPAVVTYLRQSSAAMNGWQKFVVANYGVMKPFVYSAFRGNMAMQALFRTTFGAIQVQGSPIPGVLPEKAQVTINIRLLQGDTPDSIERHIKSLLADLPVTVEMCSADRPTPITDTETVAYDTLKAAILKHFDGVTVLPTIIADSTDSKHYLALSPNVFRFSPLVLNKHQVGAIHWTDEYIQKQNMGVAVEFYKTLMSAL